MANQDQPGLECLQSASKASFLHTFGPAGVLCRMQNGLYGQRYQRKAKRDARSLSLSEIDKDGTLLIGFQDYKSENNKGK